PDRVGEDVQPVHLHQHGGVVHEGDAQLALADPDRRRGRGRGIDVAGPSARESLAAPARDLRDRRLAGDLVVEPLAVEMDAEATGRSWAGEDTEDRADARVE